MKVMKYQQQGIPLQRAVANSHDQCSQQCAAVMEEFSAHAQSTSVQVRKSRNMGQLQIVKDEEHSEEPQHRAQRETHDINAT